MMDPYVPSPSNRRLKNHKLVQDTHISRKDNLPRKNIIMEGSRKVRSVSLCSRGCNLGLENETPIFKHSYIFDPRAALISNESMRVVVQILKVLKESSVA